MAAMLQSLTVWQSSIRSLPSAVLSSSALRLAPQEAWCSTSRRDCSWGMGCSAGGDGVGRGTVLAAG
jgi:hypothetical protein